MAHTSSTKDRLAALVAAQSHDSDYFDDVLYIADAADPNLGIFFTKVQNIRDMLVKIHDNIEQVKKTHGIILANPDNDERSKQRLESLMDDTNRTVNRVRAELKNLKILEEEDSSARARMHSIQLFSLTTSLVKLMTEYNRIEVEYRERCKMRLQRHLEIAGRQTTDDQLEEMLEQGYVALLAENILTEKTLQAKQTVADIEARHAEIVKLEKSIKELHDMFVYILILVESQGKVCDRIEYQVSLAKDWVERAKDQLKEAEINKNYIAKKKIAIIAMCILIIVVIFIAATF